jgi:uncharacterized membrane protein
LALPPQGRAEGRGGRLTAAVVLGIGFGGFFDGIVFHQILQWHHMLSSPTPPDTVAGLQLNTLADGLFHGMTWVISLIGVLLLWRASGEPRRPGSGRTLIGGFLAGWGLFNLVEGIVDHMILGIHHVRPGPDQALYDVAFLIWGAAFLAIGWALIRSAPSVASPEQRLPRR